MPLPYYRAVDLDTSPTTWKSSDILLAFIKALFGFSPELVSGENLHARLTEYVQIIGGLTDNEKKKLDRDVGIFLQAVWLEAVLGEFPPPGGIEVRLSELTATEYDGVMTMLANAHSGVSAGSWERLRMASTWLAFCGLHPSQTDPIAIGTGQVAAQICDYSIKKYTNNSD